MFREARETIAKTLKCAPKEIFFTSGGTESDNLAIPGGGIRQCAAGAASDHDVGGASGGPEYDAVSGTAGL